MDIKLIEKITGLFSKHPVPSPDTLTVTSDNRIGSYGDMELSQDRIGKYREYDEMLVESKLAERAVRAHADTCVAGKDTEANIEIVVEGNDKAKKASEEIVARLGLKYNLWRLAYQMIGYGDDYHEIICDKDGPLWLKSLKQSSMKIVVSQQGIQKLEQGAYEQVNHLGGNPILFSYWQIMHSNAGNQKPTGMFVESGDPYGVDFSLLKGARKNYKRFNMLADSMVVQRISRAPQRFKHIYDTGDLNAVQADEYIRKKKEAIQRSRMIDSEGRLKLAFNPLLEEDDFLIARSEKLKNADIEILQGDSGVSNITDIEFIRNLYVSDLETPKPLLGFEEDTRTRATLSGMDVQFARAVRRWQLSLSAAIKLPIYVGLVMKGIDPIDMDLQIQLPPIGTVDELIILQTEKLRADIVKLLNVDVGIDLRWLLTKFFNMSEEEATELVGKSWGSAQQAAPPQENVERLAGDIIKDPVLRSIIEETQDFVDWKKGYR